MNCETNHTNAMKLKDYSAKSSHTNEGGIYKRKWEKRKKTRSRPRTWSRKLESYQSILISTS